MPGLGAIECETAVVEPSRRDSEPPLVGFYLNERLVQSAMLMIGCRVNVLTVDGSTISGVLNSISPEFKLVLGLAHRVAHEELPPAAHDIFQKLILETQDIVTINTVGEVEAFTKSGFVTDSAISGHTQNGSDDGKQLEMWDPDDEGYEDGSIESHSNKLQRTHVEDNNARGWCPEEMFKQNAQLGVESTFKDDLSQYTTVMPEEGIDSPEFRIRRQEAEKLARQIEQNPSSRAAAALENDDDEKDITAWSKPATHRQDSGSRGRGGRGRGGGGRGYQGPGGRGMYTGNKGGSMPRGMMVGDMNRGGPNRYSNQHNRDFDQWTNERTKNQQSNRRDAGGHSGGGYGPQQSPGAEHPPSRRGGVHTQGHPEQPATLPRAANKKTERGHLETLRQFGDNFKLSPAQQRLPGPQQMHPPRMQNSPHNPSNRFQGASYSAVASQGTSPRHEEPQNRGDGNGGPGAVPSEAGAQSSQPVRYAMPNTQVPPPIPASQTPPPPNNHTQQQQTQQQQQQQQPPGVEQETTPDHRLMDTSTHSLSSTSSKKFTFNVEAASFTPRGTPGSASGGNQPTQPNTPVSAVPITMPPMAPAYPPPTPSPAQSLPPNAPPYAVYQTPQMSGVGGQGVYAAVPPMSAYQTIPNSNVIQIGPQGYPTSIIQAQPQQMHTTTTTASSAQRTAHPRKGSHQMVQTITGPPIVQPYQNQGQFVTHQYAPQGTILPAGTTPYFMRAGPMVMQVPGGGMGPVMQQIQQQQQGPNATEAGQSGQPTIQYVQPQPGGQQQYIVQQAQLPQHQQQQAQQNSMQSAQQGSYTVNNNGGQLQHPPPSSSNTSSMSGPVHMQQMQQPNQQSQPQVNSNNPSQPPTPGPPSAAYAPVASVSGQPGYGGGQGMHHPAMGQPVMQYTAIPAGYQHIITANPQPGGGMSYYHMMTPGSMGAGQPGQYNGEPQQYMIQPPAQFAVRQPVLIQPQQQHGAPSQSSNG